MANLPNALKYTRHDRPTLVTEEFRDLRLLLTRVIEQQKKIIDEIQWLETQLYEQGLIDEVRSIE